MEQSDERTLRAFPQNRSNPVMRVEISTNIALPRQPMLPSQFLQQFLLSLIPNPIPNLCKQPEAIRFFLFLFRYVILNPFDFA
ncbi:MAG: hypothetical protein FWE22_01450 [Firmicutes bacterium]|nr:hypothetical protein [Bacillota bacterium]